MRDCWFLLFSCRISLKSYNFEQRERNVYYRLPVYLFTLGKGRFPASTIAPFGRSRIGTGIRAVELAFGLHAAVRVAPPTLSPLRAQTCTLQKHSPASRPS